MKDKFCILILISLNFVPKGPVDNKAALVKVMTLRRTGDKPLPEPMRTQSTDAYMRPRLGGDEIIDRMITIVSVKKAWKVLVKLTHRKPLKKTMKTHFVFKLLFKLLFKLN